MTDIVTIETIRRRWQADLRSRRLDSVDRPDFGHDQRTQRLSSCGVRIIVEPPDPFAEVISFDDAFWKWLGDHKAVTVDGTEIRFGLNLQPTAHAGLVVAGQGGAALDGYLAIERSGYVEVALGHQAAFEGRDAAGGPQKAFYLITIAAYVQATLSVAKIVHGTWDIGSPVQLTVALPHTDGAFLTNVGEGWNDPLGSRSEPARLSEPHLLWHVPIEDLDVADLSHLASDIATRITQAWGHRDPVHLNRTGDPSDRLDLRRVRHR